LKQTQKKDIFEEAHFYRKIQQVALGKGLTRIRIAKQRLLIMRLIMINKPSNSLLKRFGTAIADERRRFKKELLPILRKIIVIKRRLMDDRDLLLSSDDDYNRGIKQRIWI